jgi:hypothetical protein
MNTQLKELAVKAQVEHCISHVRLEQFANEILEKVFEAVKETDTRSNVYTTHDKAMADSILYRVNLSIKEKFNK